jgi:hypothetical protein
MRGGVEEPLTRDEIDAKFRANVAFGGHENAECAARGLRTALRQHARAATRLIAELAK